jgi:altronate dehydratase small subunit
LKQEGPQKRFILLHPKDNTVTALADLTTGEAISLGIRFSDGEIVLSQDIPYAHKFARVFIPKGGDVMKYGEVIGEACEDIQPGVHVHIHNVVGKRARGKLL